MTSETYKKAVEIQSELGNLENKYNTLISLKEDLTDGHYPVLKINSLLTKEEVTFLTGDIISSVIDLLMENIMARINQLETEFAQL